MLLAFWNIVWNEILECRKIQYNMVSSDPDWFDFDRKIALLERKQEEINMFRREIEMKQPIQWFPYDKPVPNTKDP
jgi:hypothetical protein